jgi:hypothetical protein
MSRGLPNLRLPEAPGIRNAPTLRQQPDNAATPPPQFHLPTTGIGRTARSHFQPPDRANRSPTLLRAPTYPQLDRTDLLGGLIHEYDLAA